MPTSKRPSKSAKVQQSTLHEMKKRHGVYVPSVILLAACAVGLLVNTSNKSREPQSWNLSLDMSRETTWFFLAEM